MGTWNSVSVASDSSMTLCTNLPVQWILTQTHLINGIPNAHISAAQELSMPYPSTVVCSCNTSKATFQSRETHWKRPWPTTKIACLVIMQCIYQGCLLLEMERCTTIFHQGKLVNSFSVKVHQSVKNYIYSIASAFNFCCRWNCV